LPFQCPATCKVLERRLGTPRAHNGSRKLAPNRPFQHTTRYCSRSFIRIHFARKVECSLHHPGTLPRTTSFYLLNRRLLALSEQSALCTFFSLLPPGLAALLRSAGFFSGAVFFARMTLARSVFQGFQIGFKRFWSILYQKKSHAMHDKPNLWTRSHRKSRFTNEKSKNEKMSSRFT